MNKKSTLGDFKLRVLCQLFYPELISTGQTLTELCESLSEQGVKINVIAAPTSLVSSSKTPKDITYKNINIHRVWATQFPKLNLIGRLINQLTFTLSAFWHLITHRSKTPILVLTNPPFLALICVCLKIILKIPYVYLVFDVYPNTAVACNILSAKNPVVWLWKKINSLIYRHASHIIVIGRCMKKVVTQSSPPSCHSKIIFIPVWADDRLIQQKMPYFNHFVDKWQLANKFVVLYSGNMGRFHDMMTIIKAAHLLQDQSDILFLFVGEGHQKQALMDYVDSHSLNNCQFHSYVDRSELGALLSCASIGLVSLMPSQVGLSVPSKTFGLMAAGVPIVGLLPEDSEIGLIIQETGCGTLSHPGDAALLHTSILDLYHSPKKLSIMKENALLSIQKKYSLTKTGQRYLEVLLTLKII